MIVGAEYLGYKQVLRERTTAKETEVLVNTHQTPQMSALIRPVNSNSQSDHSIQGRTTALSTCGRHNHARKIALYAESMLSHTLKDNELSNDELIARFAANLQSITQLKSDSSAYGIALREAEEILSKLEANLPPNFDEKLAEMQAQVQTAYEQVPVGAGTLMERDVDYLKRKEFIPHNVICTNHKGESFKKPPISIAELESLFFSMGFPYVMHSRELTLFEGIEEVCDVIMVGGFHESNLSWSHLKSVAGNLSTVRSLYSVVPAFTVNTLEREATKIDAHFSRRRFAEELGYQSVQSMSIESLKDQEKAKKLIAQGYQICTVLIYPRAVSQNQQEGL